MYIFSLLYIFMKFLSQMNGKKGLVPSNFVERVKRTSSHHRGTTSSSSSAHRHASSSSNARHVTNTHHDSVRFFSSSNDLLCTAYFTNK